MKKKKEIQFLVEENCLYNLVDNDATESLNQRCYKASLEVHYSFASLCNSQY